MFLRLAEGCARRRSGCEDPTIIHEFDDSYLWQMQDDIEAEAIQGSRYATASISGVIRATRACLTELIAKP